MNWRNMTVDDVKSVMRVGDEGHPDLPESKAVFEERLKLFPEGCFVLVEDDEIRGYAISHPIRRHQPPALDSLLGEIAADADHYYIHDVAILPGSRGRGLAAECIGRLLVIAKPYSAACLVSVYGTSTFWSRFGFVAAPVDETLSTKLLDYGPDAIFMTRQD
jgi:ribosomal protein S18 acetylase RimI-like enzyme